jgi:hypothetical protein
MVKKAKKKGKPTFNRCNNCAFERVYPDKFIIKRDRDEPHYYCGRLSEPLSLLQKITNVLIPKYLDGTGADDSMKDMIRNWIHNDGDFNIFGMAIGKIVEPCPGFKENE